MNLVLLVLVKLIRYSSTPSLSFASHKPLFRTNAVNSPSYSLIVLVVCHVGP